MKDANIIGRLILQNILGRYLGICYLRTSLKHGFTFREGNVSLLRLRTVRGCLLSAYVIPSR